MNQIIYATFQDGAFKPELPLQFPNGTRVRVVVEPATPEEKQQAWEELERLCEEMPINSAGERLTRDQLHERR